MFVGALLVALFATCGAFRPSRRGEFAPNPAGDADPHLEEGDIAEMEDHHLGSGEGSGESQNAFITETKRLWPRGVVYYRIETDEWGGVKEPIFLDEQVDNITKALGQIENDVPCIDFR